VRHVGAIDDDPPAIGLLEAGEHSEQRGLAATRGPSSAKNSPRRISSETSSTARVAPKRFETPSIATIGSLSGARAEGSRRAAASISCPT